MRKQIKEASERIVETMLKLRGTRPSASDRPLIGEIIEQAAREFRQKKQHRGDER